MCIQSGLKWCIVDEAISYVAQANITYLAESIHIR